MCDPYQFLFPGVDNIIMTDAANIAPQHIAKDVLPKVLMAGHKKETMPRIHKTAEK